MFAYDIFASLCEISLVATLLWKTAEQIVRVFGDKYR